jgi:hypothetical protein
MKNIKEYGDKGFLTLCKVLEKTIQGKFFFGNSMSVVDLRVAVLLFKNTYDPENKCGYVLK